MMKFFVVLGLAAMLSACGGTKGATRGDRSTYPAPAWFTKPPKGATKLYFVGATNAAAEEATARELAIQAALAELTIYCGATVKSEAESKEVEKNGKLEQSYSLMVDVAGDEMTIREATVRDSVVGAGSDGSFDGYVLLEWPRAQYDAVIAAQRDRAQRALDLYLAASSAAKNNQVTEAQTQLREAQKVLGPMKSMVPVNHPKLTNTTLLYDAMTDLRARLDAIAKERRHVVAIAVECDENGASAACKSHRVGAIKQRVSSAGFRVSADAVNSGVARQILAQTNPKTDASIRGAGYVLAVKYSAKLTAEEDGFTFVHCGVRGVVFDTDQNRVVQVKEVKPMKGGHVHFQGAMEKGCEKAEQDLVGWLDATLSKLGK